MTRGHGGRIARRRRRAYREGSEIWFEAGRARWPLREVWVEHRDDGGRIRFRVMRGGDEQLRASYRRRGPSLWQQIWDFYDFTADEPWSWEDSDFGLFVFHLATATGPAKFRHLFHDKADERAGPPPEYEERFELDSERIRRRLLHPALADFEEVRWDDLVEVRAKFEIAGIWADKSLLVLRGRTGQCVVPVQHTGALPAGLGEALAELPGFDERSRAAVADACDYAASDRWPGPLERQSRAERHVWARPARG